MFMYKHYALFPSHCYEWTFIAYTPIVQSVKTRVITGISLFFADFSTAFSTDSVNKIQSPLFQSTSVKHRP